MNIIYKTIVGSQAYGTSIPTSDIDIKGIYVQPNDDILSFQYKEQIENYPEQQTLFIICTGSHGPFGNFRAFPTFLDNVFRWIHTKTGEVRYYRRTWNSTLGFYTYSGIRY